MKPCIGLAQARTWCVTWSRVASWIRWFKYAPKQGEKETYLNVLTMTTQHLLNVFCKKNRIREMTIFCKFWRTWATSSFFFCLSFWNWTLRLHIEAEKIFDIISEEKTYFNSNLSQIYYLSLNWKACGHHMVLHTYVNVNTRAYSLSEFCLHMFKFFRGPCV